MKATEYHDNYAELRHEIRNHLTLLSSRLQLLAAKYPYLKMDELFEQLQEDIDAIYSELNNHQAEVQPRLLPCDMEQLLNEICRSCLPFFHEHHVQLCLEIPRRLPPIRVDARLIQQAVLNILKNAAEASDAGDGVILHAEANTVQLIITVTDHGCGMTEEQQAHIFKPFISFKEGGTGLGLAMARSSIQSHHGRLDCQSIPGKGSTFRIVLPLPSPSV